MRLGGGRFGSAHKRNHHGGEFRNDGRAEERVGAEERKNRVSSPNVAEDLALSGLGFANDGAERRGERESEGTGRGGGLALSKEK